jgi:hypothetical protein
MNDGAVRARNPGRASWRIGVLGLVVLAAALTFGAAAPSANAAVFCNGFTPAASGGLFCHGGFVTNITSTSVWTSNNHACASVQLTDGSAAGGWVCSNGATGANHGYYTPVNGFPWIKSNETWGNLVGGYTAFN